MARNLQLMKCPACFNELSELHVSNFRVDVCQGRCGGIWFDAFELQRVDEEKEAVGERLLEIRRDERIIVDTTRKRECPRCAGVKLMRHFSSPKRQVEVDECPNCAGYWLDAGELGRIRQEKTQMAVEASRKPTKPTLAPETIRYLYRVQAQNRKTP